MTETTTPIETHAEMQVLFERDCAGMANCYKLGNGEYLSTTTHQMFNAYQRGYTTGKAAK